MPHGKGAQSTRKNPREDTIREEDLDTESEPVARDVITSPLSSASSYSSVSGSASSVDTGSSGSSVSSVQLEMILAANNRAMADSMAANQRTIASLISTLSPTGSVASAPPPAAAPRAQVKVPLWTEDESPTNYFSKLEKALTLNGVPRSQWGQNIHVHLTGRAQDALAQVPLVSLEDYDVIKATLLDALGDTPEFADRSWWSLGRKAGEDACAFYLRIRACGILRLQGLTTKEEILEKLVLSRFLSLLPADSYAHAADRRPKDGLEAAKIVQELEQRRAYTRERQGWRQPQQSHHSGRREPSRGSGSLGSSNDDVGSNSPNSINGGNSGESGVSPISGSNSGSGVKEVYGSDNSSPSPASGAGSYRSRRDRKSNTPIICHGCGEPGHIRPQCPLRIRTVRSPDSVCPVEDDKMFVSGWIGGSPVERLKFDSGAERSLVRKDLVPPAAYTGKVVSLVSWKGNDPSKHKLAKVAIRVGETEVLATVAVVEKLDSPALLGADLGRSMTRQLITSVLSNLVDEVPKLEVVRVNRAPPKQAAAVEQAKDIAPAQAESQPLVEIFGFPVSSFVPGKAPAALVQPVCVSEEWAPVDDVSVEVPMQVDSSVSVEVPMQSDCSVKVEVPMQVDCSVKVEVPMQIVPEVACIAPPVALEDIFCFDDSLFEPEDACDAPAVVVDDIFGLTVFPCEPVEASVASVVALEDISWPDLSEVEFSLPELDDDVLEASVAPACCDSYAVPKQLTDVDDEVLEVLEASVAPNIVVPKHLEVVHDEVLEAGVAGVASVDSVEIVVPMQVVVNVDVAVDWVAPADVVSDAVSATVGDYFNPPEEFFVEDQADVVASGPVVCKPMVGLDVAVFVDSLSETDPVLAPVPVARPESVTVVNFVILAMEDCIPPHLCWQSPTVLVDHCLRCSCCVTKATGKFAPGSCTVILMFDVFILVISTICSFCSCISVCLSKLLVVLFFGAFGPRTVLWLHGLDDPPWRMPGAPCVSRLLVLLRCALLPMRASLLSLLLRPSVNRKGGEMLWSLPPSTSSSLTFSWHAS